MLTYTEFTRAYANFWALLIVAIIAVWVILLVVCKTGGGSCSLT